MKEKKQKKLLLNKEIIQALTDKEKRRVSGGGYDDKNCGSRKFVCLPN